MQNPSLWFSDQPEQQLAAIRACGTCPIQAECRKLGENEIEGVWGGVLRGRAHNKTVQPTTRRCGRPECRKEFVVRTAVAKYCSDQCREAARREKDKARYGRPAELVCVRAACSKSYVPRSANSRYCCVECREADKRERRAGGARLEVLVAEWEPLRTAS
jgi:hypothetical protein